MQLYPGQPKFLLLIKENEGMTQKELAQKHCVKPATVTGMIAKLEANGFIYRVPDEADKRILRVYLTPKGRKHADFAKEHMIAMSKKMFQNFTEEDIKNLLQLTKKMKKNLK